MVIAAQNITAGSGDFYARFGADNNSVDRVQYTNIERFNITGTNKDDNIAGGNQNDRLFGGKGNDTINGNAGNDILIGVNSNDATPGNTEIDTLTGGADNDIFVLSANGKDFYATSGNGDYAKITDFSLTQDVIQLRGAATDYSVTATTIGGSLPAVGGVIPPNTSLYRGSELIAVMQGVDNTNVSLASTAFSYTDFTILNDLPPVVSIANATPVTEGQSGTNTANFNVKLSSPTTKTVTVPYTTADGTATTGDNDYVGATAGSLTFLPGETSKNISVVINSDTKIESDETFSVTLGTPTNGTLATTTTVTGTILNDDTTVTISSSINGAEGNNAGQFTLTRAGVTASALIVPYTLTGTATNGSDYNIPLSATFAAGSTTAVVNLNVIDDNIFEGATPETVIVNLTAGTNYTLGTNPTATINIADNDSRPTISINAGVAVAIAEGNTGTTNAGFTVSLSNASTETVTVNLSTADGTATTANNDYQALTNQKVTFAPGQTSQIVNVAVNGDTEFEANETFSAGLSNASNGTISSTAGTGTGTINNDDLPTLTVAATVANAGETPTNPGQFTLTRSGVTTNALDNIKYTLSGTATNGTDYSVSGATSFAAGSSTISIDLNVIDDNIFEGATPETAILTIDSNAYFVYSYAFGNLVLDRPATYVVGTNNAATVNITDNDSRPTINIADSTPRAEGNTGTSNTPFTISLSNPTVETVTVDYATADGTAKTSDSDYTATTGTLTCAPLQTTKTIEVPVIGDQIGENDETYGVKLTNAVGGTIGKATGTGTILNDETGISVSVSDGDAGEPNNNGQFLLTRSGELTNAVTVNYTLSGTATAGSDYQALSGSAVFAANQATVSIDLTLIDDTIFEGATPEKVTLTITPSINYVVSSANSGTIDIIDNDTRPVISISNTAIAEGNAGISKAGFTVSLSNASTETVTVNLSTADGTATVANSDYQALANQTVTFTPGQTSQVVNVDINGDLTFEANETFSAVLSNATNGTISSTAGTGTGTINNDDLPTISVAVTDADAAETLTGQPANTGEFTFTRVGGETVEKTFLYNLSGTANGSDYSMPGAVTFAAGSTTAKVILNPTDDNIFESATPETVILTLKDDSYNSPTNFYVASDNRPATYRVDPTNNTGTISIADNDSRPTVAISNVSQVEGNSGTTNFGFNVSLSNPTVETVTVDYSTADGTATVVGTTSLDPDYTAKSGTVTFTPLQTSQAINVAVNGDKDFEADKTFTVNLANAKNTSGITTATGTGTITNDDTLPSVTVNATNPISTEGTGEGLFTFYRTGGNLDRSLTIDFDVLGNATSRQGYGSRAGSITFNPGSTTATMGVPVANNTVYSAYRGCIIQLRGGMGYSIGGGIGSGGSGGSGGGSGGGGGAGGSGGGSGGSGGGSGGTGGTGSGVIGSGEATVTIVDDDTAPVISINDVSITEGNSGTKDLTFTVTLSNASDDVVKVDYASVDGTAKAGSDYLATTGTLNFTPSDILAGTTEFTPGETSKTITVKINGDNEIEANEAFALNLSNAVGGTLGKATGTGTINNDDKPAEIGEKADILWRNDDDGSVALWQMDGATVTNAAFTSIESVDPSWKVTGTGDFNGDKKSDVLWRNANGAVSIWQMDGSTVVSSSLASIALLDNSWKTAGTGDFNGDGKSDILWRNDDGAVVVWQMNGSTVTSSSLTSTPLLDSSWKAAGTGDFNGDGKSDILWRNDDGSIALWQMNGNNVVSSSLTSTPSLDGSWKINGTGDFNGDGKSDILWSNKNIGEMAIWQMNGARVVDSSRTSSPLPDASWKFSGVGDFNGDSKSDVLWYNANNNVDIWQMNGAQVVSSSLTSTPSSHSNWKVAGVVI